MSSLIETAVIGYLVGAVVFGSVALGSALARGRTGLKTATNLGIVAGGAWPLVVLGVVQWLAIAAVIDAARRIARARAGQPVGKACRSTTVRRGSTKHPITAPTAVDQSRVAEPTLLFSGRTQASWRTSAATDPLRRHQRCDTTCGCPCEAESTR